MYQNSTCNLALYVTVTTGNPNLEHFYHQICHRAAVTFQNKKKLSNYFAICARCKLNGRKRPRLTA